MLIGARIPRKYVVVAGAGQTSFGPGENPWETAAYDLALLDAGFPVASCNIVKYTSVLPKDATEITLKDAEADALFHHGMVLESIMAQMNGVKGDCICAGVGHCQVYYNEEHIGGFAAEYEGYGFSEFAKDKLTEALDGIFLRRYGACLGYRMENTVITTKHLEVREEYGTVLVALAFLSFEIKLLSEGQQ